MWGNPTSNLLAIVTVVTVLRQGWDILYWIIIIPYRCCNKLSTNNYKPNGRYITQTVKHECVSVHIVKQQTATFQTNDLGSIHLYAIHHTLTYILHTDVYNLDLRNLNIYTCVSKLILHWQHMCGDKKVMYIRSLKHAYTPPPFLRCYAAEHNQILCMKPLKLCRRKSHFYFEDTRT